MKEPKDTDNANANFSAESNGEAKGEKNRSFWRKFLNVVRNKYFIVTFAFVVWITFVDSNNLINWFKDVKVVVEQNRLKSHYTKAITYTDEKLKELSSNKDSLERFAREQFFFHNQDEDVFIVE